MHFNVHVLEIVLYWYFGPLQFLNICDYTTVYTRRCIKWHYLLKKGIYKKLIIINTHQKILFGNIFIKFSWVSMPPNRSNPLSKVWLHYHVSCGMWLCAAYFFDTYANLHFRKKILTPYQILYTLLAYMYKLIKDIKYKFQNSHTILMLLCVNNCL